MLIDDSKAVQAQEGAKAPRARLASPTYDTSRDAARPSSSATFRDRLRRRVLTLLSGIRLRLVWWFIIVMAVATVGSVILVNQVLVQRLDARIESELQQEVDEVRRLAGGVDPATGEPFGSQVDRIFEVFLQRNVPARHEMILTFLDGRPHLHSPSTEPSPIGEQRVPYPLHEDQALAERWAHVTETKRGRVETPVGAVEYLAVPFLVTQEPKGVFVVASFRDLQRADTDAASLAAGLVGVVMLMVGSVLAVRLAERILFPVRLVTRTARAISETDLEKRIPVEGYDEISELSATFNEMLERLGAAFATQRRFIDDAGHELRTPITVIRGHLELMSDDADDRRRTMELVSEELDRMRRMVDDLLTLARTEQPDFLRLRLVDVDELTERMLQNARGLGSRDWRLDAAAEARVTIDEQRVMQAILQLASNAVRHTRPEQRISIGSAVRNGDVRFWVSDTGPGVPVTERDRIFERFYRGRSGHGRSDGAGLGLSIVQAIADAHGGRVELDSEPGRGATFTLVLPARAAEAAA